MVIRTQRRGTLAHEAAPRNVPTQRNLRNYYVCTPVSRGISSSSVIFCGIGSLGGYHDFTEALWETPVASVIEARQGFHDAARAIRLNKRG